MQSPGFAQAPPTFMSSGMTPMPVVVMNTPSTWPLPATLVSPATIFTPTSLQVFAMLSTMRSSRAVSNPSSMTNPQVRYRGFAPMQAMSLTVPQMDSLPMFPPGNSAGDTMNPSVDMERRPSGRGSTAASSAVSRSLSKYFLNRLPMSSLVCRPPDP